MAGRRDDMQLVIGFFESRAAGLAAASEVEPPVRLAILGLDGSGRPTVTAPAPTGDLDEVVGVIAAALEGGVMPARSCFFTEGSDLRTDDVVRFGAELEAGHVAVVALEPKERVDRVAARLVALGGKTESHRCSARALRLHAS